MNKTNSKTPTLTLACEWATSAGFRGNDEGAKLFELQTKTRSCRDTSSEGDSANYLFFFSTAPLTPMESPWSTEVVALRAGWTCWPRAADSYRNTKTHLIGWGSLYPGKSLLGVIVFCMHKRLFDSCHFLWETEMVCLKWKATQHNLVVKIDAKLDMMMRFLSGMIFFFFLMSLLPCLNFWGSFIFWVTHTHTHNLDLVKTSVILCLTHSLTLLTVLFCR